MKKRRRFSVIAADRFPDPLRAMLALANVAHRPNVRLWRGPAQHFLRFCRANVFDMAFIDGQRIPQPDQAEAGAMPTSGITCICGLSR